MSCQMSSRLYVCPDGSEGHLKVMCYNALLGSRRHTAVSEVTILPSKEFVL